MKKPSSRAEQKANTRARLLISARAVFAAKGYTGATMRLIADHAEMSTGAIFINWPGKAEVYREVYGHAPLTADQGRDLMQAAHLILSNFPPGPYSAPQGFARDNLSKALRAIRDANKPASP